MMEDLEEFWRLPPDEQLRLFRQRQQLLREQGEPELFSLRPGSYFLKEGELPGELALEDGFLAAQAKKRKVYRGLSGTTYFGPLEPLAPGETAAAINQARRERPPL